MRVRGFDVFGVLPVFNSSGKIDHYVIAAELDDSTVSAKMWSLGDTNWFDPRYFEGSDVLDRRWAAMAHMGDLANIVVAAAGDLVTASDVAREYNVTRATVCNWAQRHEDFPRPMLVLAPGAVYSMREVRQYRGPAE